VIIQRQVANLTLAFLAIVSGYHVVKAVAVGWARRRSRVAEKKRSGAG